MAPRTVRCRRVLTLATRKRLFASQSERMVRKQSSSSKAGFMRTGPLSAPLPVGVAALALFLRAGFLALRLMLVLPTDCAPRGNQRRCMPGALPLCSAWHIISRLQRAARRRSGRRRPRDRLWRPRRSLSRGLARFYKTCFRLAKRRRASECSTSNAAQTVALLACARLRITALRGTTLR